MANDYKTVWKNCLQVIRDNITFQSYKTWFEPIKPVSLEN
jgi:chromosomal replication initiator protein